MSSGNRISCWCDNCDRMVHVRHHQDRCPFCGVHGYSELRPHNNTSSPTSTRHRRQHHPQLRNPGRPAILVPFALALLGTFLVFHILDPWNEIPFELRSLVFVLFLGIVVHRMNNTAGVRPPLEGRGEGRTNAEIARRGGQRVQPTAPEYESGRDLNNEFAANILTKSGDPWVHDYACTNSQDRNRSARTSQQASSSSRSTERPGMDEVCSICQMQFHNEDHIQYLECFHKFHFECIDAWLKQQPTCPLCKIYVDWWRDG